MCSYSPDPENKEKATNSVPFRDAEEAWFWFIAAQQARNEGARFTAGQSLYPRPCEPLDILKILDRLYRTRRLVRAHLVVLRHYGRRFMPPEECRAKEVRAYALWCEALERLSEVMERKGIIEPQSTNQNWIQPHLFHEAHHSGVAAE